MTGSNGIARASVDLAWSVWTELGVPGANRQHTQAVVDPEPLILASPALFRFDPRLRDEVYGWCVAHSDRISVSRLRGLLRSVPASARPAFDAFAATLEVHSGLKWPRTEDVRPWHGWSPSGVAPRLPLHRPALARLRFRACCGVGARADVLCELLARRERWTRASELTALGYSKRVLASILAELADVGLATVREEGNAKLYRMSRSNAWAELMDADGLAFPSWSRVMRLVLLSVELGDQRSKPSPVRRVLATKLQAQFDNLAMELSLDAPPTVRGEPNAWDYLEGWGARQLAELAYGRLPALGDR